MVKKITAASLIIFTAFIVLSSGCARRLIVISYESIEIIAAYEADKYFNLTSPQRESLKKIIAEKRGHHRRIFLPRYRVITDRMTAAFRRGLTINDLNYFSDAVKYEVSALADFLADDLASLLITLSDSQILYLSKKLNKYNSDERDKIAADASVRFEKKFNKQMESYTRIYGDFSAVQKNRIRVRYKNIPDISGERILYLESTQNEFIRLLRKKFRPELSGFLAKWMVRDESLMSAGHREKNRSVKRQSDELFLFVDSSVVTPAQREHAVNYVNEFSEMIFTLQEKR